MKRYHYLWVIALMVAFLGILLGRDSVIAIPGQAEHHPKIDKPLDPLRAHEFRVLLQKIEEALSVALKHA